jgi:hypothetical protein
VLDTARVLEGQARHASVHAAGVIVATRPLHEVVPLYKQSGSDDVITQWDGPTCEKMGLLKMDFLGLRTLSIIERAKKLIRETLPEEAIWSAVGATAATAGRTRSTSIASSTPTRTSSPVPAGRHDRRVPVRIGRHAPPAARDEARPPRGPDRRQRAVPPGADGPDPRLQRASTGSRRSRRSTRSSTSSPSPRTA